MAKQLEPGPVCLRRKILGFAKDEELKRSPVCEILRQQSESFFCNNEMLESKSGEKVLIAEKRKIWKWQRIFVDCLVLKTVLMRACGVAPLMCSGLLCTELGVLMLMRPNRGEKGQDRYSAVLCLLF